MLIATIAAKRRTGSVSRLWSSCLGGADTDRGLPHGRQRAVGRFLEARPPIPDPGIPAIGSH